MRQGWASSFVAFAGLLACWMMLAMPATAGGNERPVSGVLAAASGPVSVRPMADQAAMPVRLAIGAKLFFGDEIITGDGVRAQILLRDGTTFSVGEGAALVLDEFVYDPASGDGGIGVVIKKGAFRFVSGKIAKKKPQNMKVLAGTTSIAVRGTEVLGTIGGGGGDSVILISGQVDLTSIAGECVSGGASEGGDMFSISPDGALEFKADVSAAPPAFCNRSLLRSGFGVQVAAGGQLSAPGRVEPDQIDTVIDAVTIRSEPSQAPSAAEEDVASDASQDEVVEAVEAEAETAIDASLEDAAGETGVEPVVEAVAEVEQEGLSEFDKVVMRAFGMMEEEATDQQAENAVASGEIIELVSSRQQAAEDEEKQAAQDEEKQAAQDDEKQAVVDAEKQVAQDDGKVTGQAEERGLTEEDKRAEYRVGQSQSEQSDGSDDDGAEDGDDGGGGGGSPANNSPANNSPVLGSISGIAFSDTSSDDSFSNSTGTLSASDADSGDTLTYSISGGSASSALSGYDRASTGTYGTLYLNSASGAYAYVPNDSAIEGAKTTVSDSFTLAVSDGTASATQTLTTSISGADDAPSLAALSGFSFSDTAGDDSFSNGTGTASGTERDSADTLVYSISGGSSDNGLSGYDVSRTGTYGTLYLNSASGAYAYVPNDSAIEGLKTNASESFTLAVTDGSTSASQTLTTSITGADDSLSVAALAGITVTDTAADDSFSATTSSVSATERDTADTLAYAISGGSADSSESGFTHSRTGTYGTLFINSGTGAYKFVPVANAIQRQTSTVNEDFTVTITAGSDTETRTLTATVAGANDTPVLNAISSISLTDTTASDTFSSTSGTLTASDRDSGQTVTFSATNQQTISGDPNFTHGVQGTYGSLTFNANTGAYEYTPTDSLVNALRTNATDSFTLTASDSSLTSSQTLTVNIAGVDDGPSALDMQNLIDAGGQQNVGATGLRLGIVTDPEGDTVTDQTSTLNALPAWLSFGNQVLGDGSVQYFWEIGANEAPWRAGTKSMNLMARSSGIDSAREALSITFACQSDHCNDFLQSTDTTTSPAVDDPTNIGSIRTGIKIGTEEFTVMSQAQRDVLFDTSVTADGTFRVIYSSAETGSGSPAGSWDVDQTVNVDYKSRAIAVSGTVSANNIGYFDGGSDSFTYNNSMTFADTELSVDSVFGKTAGTSGNVTYTLQNGNGDTVHIDLHDQIGFMRDTNNMNAALINTNITPSSGNPTGYKDDSNQLIQQQWRLLEPQ